MKALVVLLLGLALSNATQFPMRFYFDVASKEPTKNLVVSPASVTMSLALAYLGAGGKTAEEFHDVLNSPGSTQREIAKTYGEFVTGVNNMATKDFKFTMANRVFVNQKYSLNPNYNQLAAEFLHAGAENVDFSKSEAAANTINTWVAHETNDKIKELLSPRDLSANTAAVLVNAVYFKARWLEKFKPAATKKQDFYLNQNAKVQVDMMNRVGAYRVTDLADMDAITIRIPYDDSRLDFLIVLPNKIDGLADLEEQLRHVEQDYLQTQPRPELVDLSLPKFKYEFDISLVEVLKEMGLKTMFDAEADFSKLFSTDLPVKISDVKHKAFIAVDEGGTEAAAATAVLPVLGSSRRPRPPRKINVDHPFMFVIRDDHHVYFAGRVVSF